jgi:hypothetical protein
LIDQKDIPEILQRVKDLQIDQNDNNFENAPSSLLLAQLEEEKERTCSTEFMIEIIKTQMIGSFTTKLNFARVDGKITLLRSPE